MAIQPPPPAPPAPPATTQPAAPPPAARRSGCRGCGFGCGGCVLVFVLALVLAVGGGWYFLVVQASAAVTAPATLVVFNQTVTVNGNPSSPGQSLNANDEVKTQETGHAAIQFPDGSYVRMSPGTDVRITSVQLQKNGNLQAAQVLQKVGRTLINVQHLATGATFKVDGHSVSAQVRGTQFEVLVNANLSNLIKVFIGAVAVAGGGRQVTVNAGQEIPAAANGTLGAPRTIQPDPLDPYPLIARCTQAVSTGTNPGTLQVSTGDPITTGAAPEVDYSATGGTVRVAMCYSGSLMTLSLFTPDGTEHPSRGGPSQVTIAIDGGTGIYKAIVHAVDVPKAEAYVVAFASDAACVASTTTDNGAATVRETLSNSQIANGLAQSGVSGVTIQVQGNSPTSAHVVYYSSLGGIEITWTIDFYAATPNLGAVITSVTLRGINLTTQVVSRLSSVGASITSIPADFSVDRVYSCSTANGDTMMVIEGHR